MYHYPQHAGEEMMLRCWQARRLKSILPGVRKQTEEMGFGKEV